MPLRANIVAVVFLIVAAFGLVFVAKKLAAPDGPTNDSDVRMEYVGEAAKALERCTQTQWYNGGYVVPSREFTEACIKAVKEILQPMEKRIDEDSSRNANGDPLTIGNDADHSN